MRNTEGVLCRAVACLKRTINAQKNRPRNTLGIAPRNDLMQAAGCADSLMSRVTGREPADVHINVPNATTNS